LFVSVTYKLTQAKRKDEEWDMAAGSGVVPTIEGLGSAPAHGWPSTSAAYFALAIITIATFLNFLDATAFGLVIEQIRDEFHLTNIQMGWLTGPANVVFYLVVLLPLSRLVDIYPRKIILSVGVVFIALMNSAGAFAIGFWSLFTSRMLVGAGGSAHAPGAYSLLSDSFPPEKRAFPFSLLQLGFIFATTWGFMISGNLLGWVSTWEPVQLGGISIHGWKWLLLLLAIPGALTGLLMLFIVEPKRQGLIGKGDPLPFRVVLAEVSKRRAVYAPLFISLAFGAAHALALPAWLTPLMKRSYGWTEIEIGNWLSPILFTGQMIGLLAGPVIVNWFARTHKDAEIRATAIFLTLALPFGIIGPMMPNGILALCCFAVTGACGLAAAAPQNLAIQKITPNEMRGQLTGLYLMMFTVFGMCGPLLIGMLIDKVFGHDVDVWKALSLSGVLLSPFACYFMWHGIKPYREEVIRLEALEKETTHV
jgi:MFS family permease